MQSDNNPMFRKTSFPWYDSTPLCILAAFFSLGVLLFGVAGVRIAAVHPDPWCAWVPVLLSALGLYLFISIAIRLMRRRKSQQ